MIRGRGLSTAATCCALVVCCVLVPGCSAGQAGHGKRSSAAAAPGDCLPSPFASGPSSPFASGPSTTPAAGAGAAVPDLALPCFDGGRSVRLATLRGPVIINLWASWCAPCRTELPAVQRYAVAAAGRMSVLGVITRDSGRDAPASIIQGFGLTFPMLTDANGALLAALGRTTLPVTLLVTGAGRIAYTYVGAALDEPALDGLARKYLGVEVPT